MSTVSVDRGVLHGLADAAHPLVGEAADDDALLDLLGRHPVVLIGESTHGTHDFYAERARLTGRLIEERGFGAVAIEGDWPDAGRVNRYLAGVGDADFSPRGALGSFTRFPSWMWRNQVILEFVAWLHAYNSAQPHAEDRAGFYGLDLYSLRASMEAVVAYLEDVDPPAAAEARRRYGCFDDVGAEGAGYGYALAHTGALPCEREVVAQLVDLRERAGRYLVGDGFDARSELFAAEQNAVVVKDAEEYYARMYTGGVTSWNLRDRHMARTLEALRVHLRAQGSPSKVVVWAHNSHVGDARATTKGARGQLSLGQLAREALGEDVFLLGLTTHSGEVTAAPDWGRPAHRWRVRPALADSHEALLHDVARSTGTGPRFWVSTADPRVRASLAEARPERAIGVVYRPMHERQSHYVLSHLADRYDAVLHLDRTRALEPLDRTSEWTGGEPPETYPEGL